MIVSFSVSNFRSFHGEQTFSMVASKRFADQHPEHTVPIPGTDERLLRFGVVYGANGAGKSNLLKALQFLVQKTRHLPNLIQDPFRFEQDNSEPTVFDLKVLYFGKLYRFGLAFDKDGVQEEWLSEGAEDSERVIFERTQNVVSVGAEANKGDPRLAELAQRGVPSQTTFLHAIDTAGGVPQVGGFLGWGIKFEFVSSGEHRSEPVDFDHESGAFFTRLLQSTGTGVDGLRVVGSLNADLPRQLLERPRLDAMHGEIPLPFEEESDGTRRLLSLAPILERLGRDNFSIFVDEIERGLHPILVRKLVEDFLTSSGLNNTPASGEGQLIVTTHDTSLLDLDLLRRDEIWFAEKDPLGATHLYSLADFPVRTADVRKHYLQGRFGAIPFLGPAAALAEPELKSEAK